MTKSEMDLLQDEFNRLQKELSRDEHDRETKVLIVNRMERIAERMSALVRKGW